MHEKVHREAATAPGARRRGGAFTLVELLVVIMIIGVLLGTLLPTLGKVRVQAQKHSSQAIINKVNGAVEAYYRENELLPDKADDLMDCVAKPWRKVERGRIHGPYNGADKLTHHKAMRGSQTDPTKGSGPDLFHDSFGNPILYFRYRTETKGYNRGDIVGDIYRGIPTNLNVYLKGPGGVFYRADYVLITPGVNYTWEARYKGDWTTSDDQSNFE